MSVRLYKVENGVTKPLFPENEALLVVEATPIAEAAAKVGRTFTISLVKDEKTPRVLGTKECASLQEVAEVAAVNAWCPAVFSDGYRHKESFAQEDLLTYDVDDGLAVDEAVRRCKGAGVEATILLSRNHQKEKRGKVEDRFRVILPLERQISSVAEHAATWKHWAKELFSDEAGKLLVDTKAKDPARFFNASPVVYWGSDGGAALRVIDAKAEPAKPVDRDAAEARLAAWPKSERLRKAEKHLADLVRKGVLAVEGDRDSKTIWMANTIGWGHGLSEEMCFELLAEQWNPHNPHPWSDEELREKVGNAYRYGHEHAFGHELLVTAPLTSKTKARGAADPESDDEEEGGGPDTSQNAPSVPPFPQKDWDATIMGQSTVPVLDERFAILRAKDGPPTRITLKVDERNQAQALTVDEPELLAHLAKRYADAGTRLQRRVLSDSVFYWRAHAEPLDVEPLALTAQDDDRLSFCRLNWTPAEGDWSAWKEFTSRCKDPELVMGYVGACFVPQNETRQALILRGDGEDGKSTALKVICRKLGAGGGSINDTSVNESKRWLLSTVYGRRVIVYPDCKLERFCLSSTFRNLVSGDVVPIEFKGAGAFNSVMRCKLIIGTNEQMQIPSTPADRSRVLLVEVAPSKVTDDPTWEGKLDAQFPAFIHECLKAYEVRCPRHGKLIVGDVVREEVEAASEDLEAQYADAFAESFIFAPGWCLYRDDFREALSRRASVWDFSTKSKTDLGQFYKWLRGRGVTDGKSNGRLYLNGIAFKESAAEARQQQENTYSDVPSAALLDFWLQVFAAETKS